MLSLVLLNFALSFALGQSSSIDSLQAILKNNPANQERVIAYNQLALELIGHDTAQALFYASKALNLAKSIGSTSEEAIAYNRLGMLSFAKGDYEQALQRYNENLSLRLKQGDTNGIASTYLNIGNVYKHQGEYVTATDFYLKGLRLFKESHDFFETRAGLHQAVAETYVYQRKPDEAKWHYNEGLAFSKKTNDPKFEANAYLSVGNFYARQGNLKMALDYQNRASQIMQQVGYTKGLALVWNSMGNIYLQQEQYEASREMYFQSLEQNKKMGSANGMAFAYNNIGTSYAWEGRHAEALSEFEKGLAIAKEAGLQDLQAGFWENMSYSYEALGDYKKAFLAYFSFDSISNILLNEASARQVNELQVQYDTEKKQRQIESLQQKEALQEAKAERRETQMKALVAGLLLFIGLGAALIFAYRQKQKANQLLNQQKELVEKREKEKELLLRELNHRVKNNLQVIASMLSLQSFQLEDQKAVEAVKEGQSRVEAMFLIHERLYRDDQVTHIDMEHYIKQLLSSISYSFGYTEKDAELKTDVQVEPLVVDIAIPLGLIINELITNAFKHAFKEVEKPGVWVNLRQDGEHLKLNILDNGPGLPEETPGKESISFGMEMIRSLLKQLRGTLKTSYEKGSNFEITLPLTRTS